MASPLDTLIKNEIKKGFKGQLLTGTLRSLSIGTSLDDLGDVDVTTASTYTFNGFVDTYSEFFRMQNGIPDSNVKILIIAGSLSVRPAKDDEINLRSKWYKVLAVDTDPAEATWELRAFEIADPTA